MAFFAFSSSASALVQTSLFLDSGTMERGYTVVNADQQFRLGVFPETFDEGALVSISNSNEEELVIPQSKMKVSNAYTYTVHTANPQILTTPLSVELNYYPHSHNNPGLYYFDQGKERWVRVPSAYIKDRGTIRGRLPFPHAKIVLFEDVYVGEEDLGIALESQAAVVLDAVTGDVLFEKNKHKRHSLASLTKLMTGLVFLEKNPGWDKVVSIHNSDQVGGAQIPFYAGEKVSVSDLFKSMLIRSANNSAHALARVGGGTIRNFVRAMNVKASQLGLSNTYYTDPTGLYASNISTPYETAMLARDAFSHDVLEEVTSQPRYSFYSIASNRYTVYNTNKLLGKGIEILGGKTGYLGASGYNLVLKVEQDGREVIVVLFGAPTRQASFDDASMLTAALK